MKMSVELDPVDNIKLARAATARGMTVQQALRIIARSGVAFFWLFVHDCGYSFAA